MAHAHHRLPLRRRPKQNTPCGWHLPVSRPLYILGTIKHFSPYCTTLTSSPTYPKPGATSSQQRLCSSRRTTCRANVTGNLAVRWSAIYGMIGPRAREGGGTYIWKWVKYHSCLSNIVPREIDGPVAGDPGFKGTKLSIMPPQQKKHTQHAEFVPL